MGSTAAGEGEKGKGHRSMGQWEHARPYWWQYRTSTAARPFAGAIRQQEPGPDGPPLWDVRSVSGVVPLVEGVRLEEAMAVVERAADRVVASCF